MLGNNKTPGEWALGLSEMLEPLPAMALLERLQDRATESLYGT